MTRHEQQTRWPERISNFFGGSNFSGQNLYKKILLAVPFIFNGTAASAFNWDGYHFASESIPPVKLVNPGFEQGVNGWEMSDEGKVLPGVGSTMSHGLVIERRDPHRYVLVKQKIKGVLPGRRYNLRVLIRCEDVRGGKTGASICIEHADKDNKFISLTGSYPHGVFGTTGWTEVKINGHLIPPKAAFTTVALYLGQNTTGKAFFDDLLITPAAALWTIYPVNAPQNRLRAGNALRCRIASCDGKPLPSGLRAHAEFNGKEAVADIHSGWVEFAPSKDWRGHGELKIRVFDPVRKLIYAETGFDMHVDEALPKVSFDSHGRTLLDGKKFLPIGIFCNISNRKTVDQIREAGFNVAMPYNSVHMGIDSKRGYDGIAAALDYCAEKQLRVIFCLKGVYPWGDRWVSRGLYGEMNPDVIAANIAGKFGSHPAMMGYYTADEVSQQYISDLIARKKLLNRLDPDHPVWQVHSPGYNTDSLIPYGPSCDVIGIDYYPFRNPAVSRLDSLETKLKLAGESGLPQWFVPQMFNHRRYSRNATDAAFPTLGEYRAQLLVAAGCGMKAFIFYVYQPLCLPDPVLDGDAENMRGIIRAGNTLLKDMEKFILSDHSPEKLPVKVTSGKVSAWRFHDDSGRTCIAVVSLVPGHSAAELEMPDVQSSAWGKTVKVNGKWRFEANGIDCDLLTCPGNIGNR